MATEAPRVAYESQMLDYYLGVGISAADLARLSLQRPDLEIRIWNGRIGIAYKGEISNQGTAGYEYTEPTVDDWMKAVALVGKVAQR